MAEYIDCSVIVDGVHVGNVEPPPGKFCGWNYTAAERAQGSLDGHALALAVKYGGVSVGELNTGSVGFNKAMAWRATGVEPYIRGDWYNSIKSTAQADILSTALVQAIKTQYGNLTIKDWPGYPVVTPAPRDYAAEAVQQLPGAYFTGDVSALPQVSAVTSAGLLRPATIAGVPPAGVPPSLAGGTTTPTRTAVPMLIGIGGGAAGGSVAGPVGLIIGAALGVLFTIFGRGGVNRETREAIQGLRNETATIADTLQRWTWQIARSVGWLIVALQKIWVRVLRPLIEKVQETVERVARIIDRVLKPYLDFMKRIRTILMRIYDHYITPILILIQRIRRVLSILALLRVPFAQKLDRKLAEVQGRIDGIFQQVLYYANYLGRWINVILNARMLLQQPIFVNSARAYRSWLVQDWWNEQSRPLSSGERAQITRAVESMPLPVVSAELAAFGNSNSGAFAAEAARVNNETRRYLGI